MEVELLIGCGGSDSYQVLTNSECYKMKSGRIDSQDVCLEAAIHLKSA
jgi:hypothetical protein